MEKDFKDKMENYYQNRLKEQKFLGREELLQKQIEEYEIFVKYLYFYIDEINLRLNRLRPMLEKETKKKK